MNMSKTAFIPSAGLGTRLAPLTDTTPKALVRLHGKPLLYHTIMKLKAAGYERFVINIHHFAQQIIDYCASERDFEGLEIRFSDERDCLMDTGGGIYKARPLLEGCGEFLVHNVDILTQDIDFKQISLPKNSLASLLVSQRPSSRGLFYDSRQRLKGWKNFKTGDTLGQTEGLDFAAFSGISILSDKIFDLMEGYAEGPFSIISFYLDMCQNHEIHCNVCNDLKITDIGKIETLRKLESGEISQ